MCGNFRALACLWRWRSCNCAGGRGRCWSFPFDGVSLSVSWHRFVGLVHFHRCPPLNYGRPFFNRIWSRWSASSRPAPLSSLAFRGFHEVGSFHFFCGLSAFHSPLFAKFYGLCLSGRLGVSFIGERNYARRSCSAVYCVKVNVLWVISCLFPVLFYTLLDFFLVFVFLETLVTDDASHMVFKTIFSLVYVLGVIPIRIRVKFNHFCKAASSIFHVDFWVKKKTRGGRPGATLGRRWIKSNLFSSSYFLRSFPSAHPLPSYPIKSFSVVGTAVKPGHTHGKRGRNTSRRCGDFGPKTSDKTQSNLTENNQMKKKYYLNSLRNDLRDLSWKSIHRVGKASKRKMFLFAWFFSLLLLVVVVLFPLFFFVIYSPAIAMTWCAGWGSSCIVAASGSSRPWSLALRSFFLCVDRFRPNWNRSCPVLLGFRKADLAGLHLLSPSVLPRLTQRPLPGFTGFLTGFTEFYWVLLGFIGIYWALPGSTGFYWVLLGFSRFNGV